MSERFVEIDLEVPFHDVDAMEVAWHGHYAKYCEVARCALLQRFEYDYPQMRESGYFWPIVELTLKYVQPARYGQKLRIRATLTEHENRIKIAYLISDAESGARITKGHSVQVAVDATSGEMQFVSPDVVLEKLVRLWPT